ncbi:hypothetical protein [Desulfoscipio gibsoniae]
MTTMGKRYDKDFKLSAATMTIAKNRCTNGVADNPWDSYDRRFCRGAVEFNKNDCRRGIELTKKIGE